MDGMAPGTLSPDGAVPFILSALEKAHERAPRVGGLFNAYELAVHYEIFNAALAHGLDDTWQEAALPEGRGKCDLVLPLGTERLWLEVKSWWFLHHAYKSPYVNQAKTTSWPASDWLRLAAEEHRAVLLLRTWDGEGGKAEGDRRLEVLDGEMRRLGAPAPVTHGLNLHSYKMPAGHWRAGDAIIWSSTLRDDGFNRSPGVAAIDARSSS